MKRSYFLKTLLGWPIGGFLAKILSLGKEHNYLLNRFFVAGFQHYEGPSIIENMAVGEQLQLSEQPDNKYDKFAVAILRKDVMIGYVPRTDNKHVSRLLQQEVNLKCIVAEVNPQNDTWKMLRTEVYL